MRRKITPRPHRYSSTARARPAPRGSGQKDYAARNNSVSIGSVGAGNTITVTQQRAPDAEYIEYKITSDTVERVSREQACKSRAAFIGGLALSALGTVADVLTILSVVGLPVGLTFGALLPIGGAMAWATNSKRKLITTVFGSGERVFIDGKWAAQEADGSYVRYATVARCAYPGCSGTVFVQPAPPREQPNRKLVGVCDVGEQEHTYTVDKNLIGRRKEFDWKPIGERGDSL